MNNSINVNLNNRLSLKRGKHLAYMALEEDVVVAIPTVRAIADMRVLDVNEDGSFTTHWTSNYNLDGDFSSEVMSFGSNLELDVEDKQERSDFRVANGLMPLS